MYLVTFAISTLHFIPVALIPNIGAIIVFRFIGGCAGSTGSTMVGGSISDSASTLTRVTQADAAQSGSRANEGLRCRCFRWRLSWECVATSRAGRSDASQSGGGPAFMGYVPNSLGWYVVSTRGRWLTRPRQWIQWIQGIVGLVTMVLFLLFLRETRGTVILSRKAARLRKETGDERYQCKADAERASLMILVKVSLTRPLWFLISEPVVIALTAWISFAWAVMWGLLEAFGHVMQVVYGFDTGAQGLCFFSLVAGAILGVLTNQLQERVYRAKFPTKGAEARLYASMVCAPLLPIGLFIFGASQGRAHWMGPIAGATLLMLGIFHIYIAVCVAAFCSARPLMRRCSFLYLADAYQIYASSALAAQSFVRNMAGGAFVLFVVQVRFSPSAGLADIGCPVLRRPRFHPGSDALRRHRLRAHRGAVRQSAPESRG